MFWKVIFISSYTECFSAHTFAVLRYLRSDRNVLHRDISKGNVLYIEEQTTLPADAGCGLQNTEPKEVPLCFIKYLLEERYVINRQLGIRVTDMNEYSTDPHKTSALVIDFNNAERLDHNQERRYKRTSRTVSYLLSLFYELPSLNNVIRERLSSSLVLFKNQKQCRFPNAA